ncbi:MAG: hypothetical protein ACKVW3_11835 [Phycisphaerales bacterium]
MGRKNPGPDFRKALQRAHKFSDVQALCDTWNSAVARMGEMPPTAHPFITKLDRAIVDREPPDFRLTESIVNEWSKVDSDQADNAVRAMEAEVKAVQRMAERANAGSPDLTLDPNQELTNELRALEREARAIRKAKSLLTSLEYKVWRLSLDGMSSEDIAKKLKLSNSKADELVDSAWWKIEKANRQRPS